MMNDLLKGILGESVIIPPEIVSEDLKSRFPCSMNIEWSLRDKKFEALFYCNGIEYIASYSKEGGFLNYRENVSPADIPGHLNGAIIEGEEVMNVVKVVEGDGTVSYEIISRNSSFDRFLVITDKAGNVTGRAKL